MGVFSYLVVAFSFVVCAVAGAEEQVSVPNWAAPIPNHSLPLGGLSMVKGAVHVEVYHGGAEFGTYNHAAMIDYFNGTFFLAWKNGPESEDKDGQRILFSQSRDGLNWSTISNDRDFVLFPSLTTKKQECAMFVGPPIRLNGRQYVGASPGVPTDAAAGAQFCLWPDPVSPRTCGPPGHTDFIDILLMRQVIGIDELGPMFWASANNPKQWADATQQYGIKSLADMDDQTKHDVSLLSEDLAALPCAQPSEGTLKCEACLGGCQIWNDIHVPPPPPPVSMYTPQLIKHSSTAIGNERAHYVVPSNNSSATLPDVILYRSGLVPQLFASVRTTPGQKSWPTPQLTNIPNDESNLNTGALPDGRVYLVNNAVVTPKVNSSVNANLKTLRYRDPVTIATSRDGYTFANPLAVISCTSLPNNSTCSPRFAGGGKNPGPSYPQGLTVVNPAPPTQIGFYVVATNNKEDVWITKLDFENF
eukprot:m.99701 g.99701  ORF g.99701 m.99701 type:complete len:474 (+) comp27180_c1_seq2:174-1595(+)